MSSADNTLPSRPVTDGRAYYKITRTATGTDGKTRTETVEVVDDEATNVSYLNDIKYAYFYMCT